MPYIKKERRDDLLDMIGKPAQTPGELNFLVTSLIKDYIEVKGLNYQTINDIKGALGCAWDEFYRRKGIPYEDKKIEENGDVW